MRPASVAAIRADSVPEAVSTGAGERSARFVGRHRKLAQRGCPFSNG